MTIAEFIEETNRLEKYYDKELTDDQRKIMYEELKKLSVERFKKLISVCIRTCKFMPKVADLLKANGELLEQGKEEKRTYYPCKKCDQTGYVFYTKFITNGMYRVPYVYVAKCTCENTKYVYKNVKSYEELNIKIGTREQQIRDTQRCIELINDGGKEDV